MFTCPCCGNTFEVNIPHFVYNRCPNCGHEFLATPYDQLRMYKTMRNSRLAWRFIFVLMELCSFGVALLLCWLFAKIIDTDVFQRHSYLVIAVWLYIAYKIYVVMKPKIA